MTTDNVIDVCDNINDLEADYEKWSMLTYDQKKISDDICMNIHGVNNTQFYEQQKALLLTIDETAYITEKSDEALALQDKLNQTKIELQNEPMAVIIPVVYINPIELEFIYDKYKQLTQQYKNISNGISLKIWGITVDDAYEKVKGIAAINTQDEAEEEEISDFIENSFININNILENKDERVSCAIKPHDYINDMPQIVPYLNYSEYCNLFKNDKLTVSNYINIEETKKYYDTIERLQLELESASAERKIELEDSILKLGWFPYKKINGDTIKEARERQAKWFNENMQVNIIDISKYNIKPSNDILNETEGITGDVNRLQPIFLSFISTNNLIGKLIKGYTKSYWTHAGIALDSKLDKIYTFSAKEMNRKKNGGFRIESLKLYSDLEINDLLVLCFFVDQDIKKKIIEELKFYEKNQSSTKYDKLNYFNIAFNLKKDSNSMQMVCSQFVDYILKLAGIDITNKSSNLVTPKDLSNADNNAINIYALFEGKINNYKQKEIDSRIKLLLDTLDYSKLCATTSDNMKNNIQNSKIIESFLEVCTDNEEINSILREVRSYIAPSSLNLITDSDIENICEENHKNIMTSSHADIDHIVKLLYENRGLKLYIKNHNIKNNERIVNVLETDFSMHRNILSNISLTGHNFYGFAGYYEQYLNKYNMKYNG